MNFIFSTLIVILIILLFSIVAAWLDRFGRKRKEEFLDEILDKVSNFVTSHLAVSIEKCKTVPWYLVVYTRESNLPIWISNNNIRSVHPDALLRKLIIKQFYGEDMVIENVENYELCSANEMCDYDM